MSSMLPESFQDIISEDNSQKRKKSLTSLAPLVLLAKNAGIFILLGTQMVMCQRMSTLEQTNAPAFVQSADGSGIPIEVKDSYFRSENTVRTFLSEWLLLAHNWGPQITGDDGKLVKDVGQNARGIKVPTGPFVASFAIQPGFAEEWAKSLIRDYDLPSYLAGDKSRFMVVHYIGQPKIEEQGKRISIRVNATWFEKSEKAKNYPVAYEYKRIFVLNPIDAPAPKIVKNASPFDKAIYSVLAKGIRIEAICPPTHDSKSCPTTMQF